MITCSKKKAKRRLKPTGIRRNLAGEILREKIVEEGKNAPVGPTTTPECLPHNIPTRKNGHDIEDSRDLLDFVEQGLKKDKFRECTGRSSDRDDDRRTRQRVDSPDSKSVGRKDDRKDGVTRREIKMISGGLPDEGNPPSRKAAKRSRNLGLAVEVMPRALADKSPLEIAFSPEEISKTTDTLNRPLVISMDAIDVTIQ
ncbi:hypothetical protein PIB30_078123 [Stylosanthes scabra]|uniref:Uncharacterized protein n=1 Tax=Stylosanthes scabra TaxID=79078 RepID=A0ABU6TQB2_9FABA|nr:hypothetical protein [Stylosanthes scabra]